ncbi:protein phosphatase 2C domain-containing protein [Streptosporangium sp. NPDC051023]|uniref:protein phosphatase 2C domain-containing protein n=1 Tax=Streptosporangium sp. NPDC051023 TaxID=3155410 RepID=UPI00344DF4F8
MKRLQAKPRFIPAGRVLDPLVIGSEPMKRPVTGVIPDATGKRPDSELDGADLPELAVRAASIRGDAHRHDGVPRRDAMGLWQIDESRLLACVAGGLADDALSHLGSAEACSAARRNLLSLLRHAEDGLPAEDFFGDVARDLTERAEREGVPADTLRTTLLTAIIDTDEHRAHVTRVGDGTAMLLREGVWTLCLPEETGTPAPGTLPEDSSRAESAIVDLRRGDMLLLCTGGLARPMRGEQVSEQVSAWWAQPTVPSLPEFFWQLSFRAEDHDDDRTAICAWRC